MASHLPAGQLFHGNPRFCRAPMSRCRHESADPLGVVSGRSGRDEVLGRNRVDGAPRTLAPTPPPITDKKDGAFAKLKKASADRSAEKRETKEAQERKWAEDVAAAGALVTSGTFGLSTVEIDEGGYVRVALGEQPERPSVANVRSQMAANLSGGGINAKTPYEKLRSITFKPSDSDQVSQGGSGLESAIGPAVAGLLKGTKHLMKASAPGLAAAGIAHVASQGSRTSYLTIATDRQIYTLSNQIPNSVGLKTAKRATSTLDWRSKPRLMPFSASIARRPRTRGSSASLRRSSPRHSQTQTPLRV